MNTKQVKSILNKILSLRIKMGLFLRLPNRSQLVSFFTIPTKKIFILNAECTGPDFDSYETAVITPNSAERLS